MIDFLLNVNTHLEALIVTHGFWVYAILFAIIFSETGLVFTAFLPGDSLLFMIGALCAKGDLNFWIAYGGLMVAAILGNTCNYFIGRYFGDWLIRKKYVNMEYIQKTEAFFSKHGGKTVVFSRFLPIFRTFVPFFSGLSKMNWLKFKFYNILGAFLWITCFMPLGYFLGNIPIISKNLDLIVIIGMLAAIGPLFLAYIWRLFQKKFSKKSAS
jgi:membrane-associated protein